MDLVYSNLNEYLNDQQIIDSLLLERISLDRVKERFASIANPKMLLNDLIQRLNNTTQKSIRKNIATTIMMLMAVMGSHDIHHATGEIIDIKVNELVRKDKIDMEEVKEIFKIPEEIIVDSRKVSKLNSIVPNRFSSDKLGQYNRFDIELIKAIDKLKAKGEKPNTKLIKAIMLVETGMIPRKNRKGYEGFPQTNQRGIDEVNQRFGTNFTLQDMYDPIKSVEFIHYKLKLIFKSKHVNDDVRAAGFYNWGNGNWYKHFAGKQDIPKETRDYMKMVKAFMEMG